MNKEIIASAAAEACFYRTVSCCDVDLKYCNGDEWTGNLEAFANVLIRRLPENVPTDDLYDQLAYAVETEGVEDILETLAQVCADKAASARSAGNAALSKAYRRAAKICDMAIDKLPG